MNNEINTIFGMIAGSGVFKARFKNIEFTILGYYNNAFLKFGMNPFHATDCTILAKRVEDMGDNPEIHAEYLMLLDHKDAYPHNEIITPKAERFAISKGYLPEYLADKLIENKIKVEWI